MHNPFLVQFVWSSGLSFTSNMIIVCTSIYYPNIFSWERIMFSSCRIQTLPVKKPWIPQHIELLTHDESMEILYPSFVILDECLALWIFCLNLFRMILYSAWTCPAYGCWGGLCEYFLSLLLVICHSVMLTNCPHPHLFREPIYLLQFLRVYPRSVPV